MSHRKRIYFSTALVVGFISFTSTGLADPPKVERLRVQKVGPMTYFHLVLESPADMCLRGEDGRFSGGNEWDLSRLPRLVPQDGKTNATYLREPPFPEALVPPGKRMPVNFKNADEAQVPAGIDGDRLEFLGKVQDKTGKAKVLLQYPTNPVGPVRAAKTPAQLIERQASWVEIELTLDFSRAQKVDVPAVKRTRDSFPHTDDLEGAWAVAQGSYFAMLQGQTPEFGFYGFAREATGRKYTVPVGNLGSNGRGQPEPKPLDGSFFNRQLYEVTTGAAAITESMALQRMRNPDFRSPLFQANQERSVDVGKVQGVMIAEHPLVKMMAGKKPAPEPLANLVPADNYYVHFNNLTKFLETGDLFDQWGTTLTRAFEVSGRDYQLKDRLEQQLCLKSTKLARIFGPAVVKSLALTGSDPYLREGSDVAVIFHVASKPLFQSAAEPHLKEARGNFAGKLKEDKQTYRDIVIESFVSPLREVSLHRAFFDDFIVYSNSPAGIRRVIDVHKGKLKSLAQSLDFQYMRTVFAADDPLEDGFVFFSDAFLRNLVGPALRIKERRRLEALTSLSMANNAALFIAWETGQLPTSGKELLAYTGLKADHLYTPDGDGVFWNNEQMVAQSGFYNTLSFATPLIEIPIDKITPGEQAEYEQFRREYMGLWRQYFDPIGMRIKLMAPTSEKKESEVRLETYVLPLVQTSQYNDLRRLAGDGIIKLDPGMFNPKTIAQFISHISPTAGEREQYGNVLKGISPDIPGLNWMGNWFTLRLDDSPVYGKLAQRMIMREIERGSAKDFEEDVRLFFQMPVTLGVEVRNPFVFAAALAAARKAVEDALPGAVDWAPLKEKYKGTAIVQIKARPEGPLGAFGGRKDAPFTPALYYALIDGAWYISLREECIHDEIDAAIARKQPNAPVPAKVDVNTSVYFNPQSAVHARELLGTLLEWQTHRQAIAGANLLYPLYRGKVVSATDDAATIRRASLKYFGFVPVSPDYSPYVYEMKTDEIVSKRHGNLRRPHLQETIDPNAPLAKLLEQFRTLRADLRFREDGLHSVVTFTRK
jgi:hypothetical protein